MSSDKKKLGFRMERAREAKFGTRSVCKAARLLDVSNGYLRDVEKGIAQAMPSEALLRRAAGLYEVPEETVEEWIALTGRIPERLFAKLLENRHRFADVERLLDATGGA